MARMTALWVGILTLGIEIVSGRLLAPFFGSSLHQWAALIGVALLAYVAGYAGFGPLTRQGPAIPLAAGGLYVLSLPFWLYAGVERMLGLPLSVASVLGAAAAVGVPSVLWASILPYLQRSAGEKGSARMLSWSALGNLAGAWGIAFAAVPMAGTRLTLIGIGVAALVLAALWLPRAAGGKKRRDGALAASILLLVGGVTLGILGASRVAQDREPWRASYDAREDVPADASHRLVSLKDSPYQQVAVWDRRDGGGVIRRALSLNGSLQFLWEPGEKLTAGLRYEYYNFSTAAALWTADGRARKVMVLGLGGGLIPWQLRQYFADMAITSYELDPVVAQVAAHSLPLGQAGAVDVRIGDGRTLLRQDGEKYDYILLDTFLNSYVPFHLTTREFFELARSRLNPGGILVANFHTVFAASGLLPKLEATISSVFPSVGVLTLPAGTTLVVAAGEQADLRERLRKSARSGAPELGLLSERAASGLRPARSAEPELILTDDRNDTEQRLYETRKHVVVSRPI